MKFSAVAFGSSLIASALAASNAFTAPLGNVTVLAGSTLDITWANASGSTVDLLLKAGDANNLHTVATIGSNIPNQGGVAWTVPTDIQTGDYALELDASGEDPNYTGFFRIIGQNTTSSSSENAQTSTTAGALVATGSANATSAASNATSVAPATSTNATAAASNTSVAVNSSAIVAPTSNSSSAVAANSTSIAANATSNSSAATTSTSLGFGAIPSSTGSGVSTTASEVASSSSSAGGSRTARSSSAAATASGSAASSTASAKNTAALASWSTYALTGAIGAALFFLA